MKGAVLVLFVALMLPLASGDVVHVVDINDSSMTVSSELILTSENNVDVWSLEWSIPDGADLLVIEDESGPIDDYTVIGNKITFKTNPDIDRMREDVRIVSVVDDPFDDVYSPFLKLELALPGFEGETTTLTINNPDLITTSIPTGFSVNKGPSRAVMQGEGPVALIGYFSNVPKTTYYYTNGNGQVDDAEENGYNIIPGTIGIVPYYIEFPLFVLSSDRYDNELTDFSAGTYKTGGIILVKDTGENFADTIIHETVHAYNDQIMNWRETDSAWFDEGTAQYIEWLYRKKVGERSPEIFGEPVPYREGIRIFTILPKGDADNLWEYYQNEETWMETWNPTKSTSSVREFGYAFSELTIRKYVMDNGPDSLHGVYARLSEIENDVESADEFNRIVLGVMGTDLMPCYSNTREEFDACLEEVNNFTPTILEYSGDVSRARKNDAIEGSDSFRTIEAAKEQGLVKETIWDRILLFLRNLFN